MTNDYGLLTLNFFGVSHACQAATGGEPHIACEFTPRGGLKTALGSWYSEPDAAFDLLGMFVLWSGSGAQSC